MQLGFLNTLEGYPEYNRGCPVHWRYIMSTMEDVKHIGGLSIHSYRGIPLLIMY